MERYVLDQAIQYIEKLFAPDSGGHDASHSLRVYANAVRLAALMPEADQEIVILAALLHDADDHKLFHTENNANARAFLEKTGIEPEKIEQICRAVNSVSFSQNRGKRPETLEGKIVQDADRLDAIGAIGIARTFAFGGEHGRQFDDSIDHFYNKLLLLKEEMNTEPAKKLAEERHAFMESFLKEFFKEQEIMTTDPDQYKQPAGEGKDQMKQYQLLAEQIKALTEGVQYPLSNLSNAASLLYTSLQDINWAGFYLLDGGTLYLGPFMGNPACVKIELGKGVCGTAAQKEETVVVPDVHAFPGHIACDSQSRSEIVIPLFVQGRLFGVLDIDSPVEDRFKQEDREGLEAFAKELEKHLFFTDR